MSRNFRRTTVIAGICLLSFVSNVALHAKDGPYCGLYAVYGAASALGIRPDFESLLDPTFVSGRRGSTIEDLVRATNHVGLSAQALGGLSLASLRESSCPLVLHTTSFGQLSTYNHWLLFVGMQDGRARIVDAGGALFLMDIAELMARWDGVALAISRDPADRTNFDSVELRSLLLWALVVLMTLAGVNLIARKVSAASAGSRRTFAISMSSTVCLLIVFIHCRPALSLWRNDKTVEFIHAAEGNRTLQELTVEEMASLTSLANPPVIFDTRYDGDMSYGHLPGASALPVDLSQAEVAQRVENIPRDRTIVVYCQSQGCLFSDRMAVVLTGFGFTDVQIYRDGWVGWQEKFEARQQQKSEGQ